MSTGMKEIAVIGLGYVGLPLAVCFGMRRKVIGFDIDKKRVEELNRGVDTTRECKPEQLIKAKHLSFTCSIDTKFTSNFV